MPAAPDISGTTLDHMTSAVAPPGVSIADARLQEVSDGIDDLEGLLRDLAPQVLAAVVRRYGHFGLAEDAVQEALIAAAEQRPDRGLPARPRDG